VARGGIEPPTQGFSIYLTRLILLLHHPVGLRYADLITKFILNSKSVSIFFEMIQPILSVCFPTYNRADALAQTLNSIVSQDIFLQTPDIEIIVSDNCSTDGTEMLMKQYTKAFPGKIAYYRNKVNILDKNFEVALRHGSGKFLKLQNDNFGFLPGGLEFLLETIKSSEKDKINLFLLNQPSVVDGEIVDCNNLDALVKCISFWSTWIGGLGIWKNDLDELSNFSSESHTQLTQVDVLFRLVLKNSHTRVICKQIITPSALFRRGGYSISKVFGRNYLKYLSSAKASGEISEATFNAEKKDVLIKHIFHHYFSQDNDFKMFPLLDGLEDFEYEDYFYPNLENCFLNYVRTSGNPDLRGDFATIWRLLNPHNETYFVKSNTYKNIRVGRMSYGPMSIQSCQDPNEGLEIGSFVSIDENVNFLLGGEYPYDRFSTFPFKVKYFGQEHEAITRGKIIVNDDVWIGFGATITSGVRIGQGAIIRAGAVIANDVEPYSIVAGNPAQKIKNRFDREIIDVLIKIDYSKISEELIFSIKESLYEPMTLKRAKFLLELTQSAS